MKSNFLHFYDQDPQISQPPLKDQLRWIHKYAELLKYKNKETLKANSSQHGIGKASQSSLNLTHDSYHKHPSIQLHYTFVLNMIVMTVVHLHCGVFSNLLKGSKKQSYQSTWFWRLKLALFYYYVNAKQSYQTHLWWLDAWLHHEFNIINLKLSNFS